MTTSDDDWPDDVTAEDIRFYLVSRLRRRVANLRWLILTEECDTNVANIYAKWAAHSERLADALENYKTLRVDRNGSCGLHGPDYHHVSRKNVVERDS